jgi:hypothetical protein
MWSMIESFQSIVDELSAAFTRPSFNTACRLLVGWVMCLGKHTLGRVAQSAQPQTPPDHSQRHGLDGYYNYFARSAWTVAGLAYHVAVLIITRLQLCGRLTLLVDDTLAHKRGKSVWGMGWWRDAVASTKKRVATASGHNWVVLAIAYCLPGSHQPIFALPLLARLHLPGKGQPSCAALTKAMLTEVLQWFPKYNFTLVGDGAYACTELLGELEHSRVVAVCRLRGDACLHDPQVPAAPKGKRGPKAQKGPKLPTPKEAAAKADRKRTSVGEWAWRSLSVTVYGEVRDLLVVSYQALERLRFAVRTLPGVLAGFSEAESEQRPSPERWTKKEVIGHLIDSASNNHQRFVRGQIAAGQDFPGYEQEQWVRIQNYQAARWNDLIDLWRAYNTHLLHVAGCMSEEGKRATCRVGGGAEVSLAGLFVDYVEHLEHHLRMMLGRWEVEPT